MTAVDNAALADLPEQTPVLIAGGGPSGLFLALDLAHRGIPSLVIEPRTSIDPDRPRAKTTNARTMTHLRRLGLADKLRDAAPLPVAYAQDVIFCSALTGHEVTRFRAGLPAGPGPVWPPAGMRPAGPAARHGGRAPGSGRRVPAHYAADRPER